MEKDEPTIVEHTTHYNVFALKEEKYSGIIPEKIASLVLSVHVKWEPVQTVSILVGILLSCDGCSSTTHFVVG